MLDLLKHNRGLRIEKDDGKGKIYCSIRKKFLILQPEEVVRQLYLQYLLHDRGYSANHIAVEKGVKINGLSRRYDILVFEKAVDPLILVECKSMYVNINQDVMEQVSHYNLPLKAKFLVLTNGKMTYSCELDYKLGQYKLIEEIPLCEK